MADVLSHKRFRDEQEAYNWVEARLWPRGPACPRCGVTDRNTKLKGKSTRIGTYKCNDCCKPFTVKIGTIFEDSHIPMRLWLQAISLLAASRKGISSIQLHRTLDISRKSAWYMSHHIREASRHKYYGSTIADSHSHRNVPRAAKALRGGRGMQELAFKPMPVPLVTAQSPAT